MSLLELFAFLEERLGVRLAYDCLPWRHSDQKYFVADNAKAGRLIGWQPRMSKSDGIQTVLDWEERSRRG